MRALFIRDLRLAVRAGGGFGLALAFFLIVVVLVPFGVGPGAEVLRPIAPGMLWVAALLAALLSLDRIFALDMEDGALALIATAPLPLEGVALAKAVAHWLTTGLPLTLAAPLLGVLLDMEGPAYGWLLGSLALGTPALSMIGTFGAALTVAVLLQFLTFESLSLLAFWVENTSGFRFTMRVIMEVAGGAIIPLSFFPALVQKIFALLPKF